MGSRAGPERARGAADVEVGGSDASLPGAPWAKAKVRAIPSGGVVERAGRPGAETRRLYRADLLPTVGTSFGAGPPLAPDPRSYRADPAGRTRRRICCAWVCP